VQVLTSMGANKHIMIMVTNSYNSSTNQSYFKSVSAYLQYVQID
jgi:hypothetical protein